MNLLPPPGTLKSLPWLNVQPPNPPYRSIHSFIHSIGLDCIRFQCNFECTMIYAVLVLPSSEFQSFLTSPRFLCSTIIGHSSSSSSTTIIHHYYHYPTTITHHTTLHYTTHTPHPLSPSFSSKPWLLDA